jgi:hypothetical protein
VIYLLINELNEEYWCINLGNLIFKTHEKCLSLGCEKLLYDIYKIELNSIRMEYVRSQEKLFSVIDEFNIKTDFHIAKQQFQGKFVN